MANKHVTRPCTYSGVEAGETAHMVYDSRTKSNKTVCPTCNQLVSVNKSSRKLRSHNMPEVMEFPSSLSPEGETQ